MSNMGLTEWEVDEIKKEKAPATTTLAWAAWHPQKGFGKTPHACWDIDDAIVDAQCATILDDSPLWKAVRVTIVKV